MKDKENGTCYETAANWLMDKTFFGQDDSSSFKLVHGRPTLQRPPFKKYGHAWIEINEGFVIDTETGKGMPKELYYSAGEIDSEECFYYSFEEARKLLLKFKHYGPWEGPEAVEPIED